MKFKVVIIVLSLMIMSSNANAEQLSGKIVGVHDGDTVTLLTNDKIIHKIRLAEIDAPELDQPFGQKSKQMLSSLVFGKQVITKFEETDRYKRIVGHLYLSGTNINLSMVRNGGAWAYIQYLEDSSVSHAEEIARAEKLGMWRLQPDQLSPPWEWRKKKRASQTNSVPIPAKPNRTSPSSSFRCGSKRYCKQMSDCSEAYFLPTGMLAF